LAQTQAIDFALIFVAIAAIIAITVVALGARYKSQLRPNREQEFALPFTGLHDPRGVAVDAAGNVYVVTRGDNAGVMKLAPGLSSWTRLPGDYDFRAASGLAVDAHGNVYVTDNLAPGRGAHGSGLVVKLPAG
jgi:serine/threonine-protein kinase